MEVSQKEILNYDEQKFIDMLNRRYEVWKENSNYMRRVEKNNAPEKITNIDDIYEIPLIDMAEFKKFPEKLSIGETYYNLYSSGSSSGTRSKGPRSKKDLEKQRKFFNNLAKKMLPNSIDYFAIISPSKFMFKQASDPKISNRSVFNYAVWGFEEPFDSENFVDISSGKPKFEFEKLYNRLNEEKGDKGLFGTQKYILAFVEYLSDQNLQLDLGENGAIATGGGSSKEIEGKEFRNMCKRYFNIDKKNHVDFYGCTESMLMVANKSGDDYPDKKRIPSQGMIYVVDEDILREKGEVRRVGLNEPGLAVFIDALNESHPGAILTDDIVIKTGGIYGKEVRIEHLGRSSM